MQTSSNEGDQLLYDLMTAQAQGDQTALLRICQQRQATILAAFASWKVVPETLRSDSAAIQGYAQTLITVATVFQALGHPELLASLSGGDDNPLRHWQDASVTAIALSETGQYEQSSVIVQEILTEMKGSSGSAIDQMQPKLFGVLSGNALNQGDYATARAYAERARDGCAKISDRNGVRIYRQNLDLIHVVEMERSGTAQSKRLMKLLEQLARAQELSDTHYYASSNTMLHALLVSLSQDEAELGVQYTAKVYGLLGINHFKLHDTQQAWRFTDMALHECRRTGDDYGLQIYMSNLQVIERDAPAQTVAASPTRPPKKPFWRFFRRTL